MVPLLNSQRLQPGILRYTVRIFILSGIREERRTWIVEPVSIAGFRVEAKRGGYCDFTNVDLTIQGVGIDGRLINYLSRRNLKRLIKYISI